MDERDAHSLAKKPIVKERDPLCIAVWIHRIVLKQLRPARVYIKPSGVASSFFKNKETPSCLPPSDSAEARTYWGPAMNTTCIQ